MNSFLPLSLVLFTACAQASEGGTSGPVPGTPCSEDWYRAIEQRVPTHDAQMHGPDIGSDEWKGVIEFRLGVQGRGDIPRHDSESWCRSIDQLVRERNTTSTGDGRPADKTTAQGPSYACHSVRPGSIEAMICENTELSALDRTLHGVYLAASEKAANEHPPWLKADQRGWIKGRNECWKSDDRAACVREAYVYRTAELQARYRLVPGTGPVRYVCDGNPANEVVVMYFQTDPPTLIAERGDSVSLMYGQATGSGAKFQGRNESLWEHQGEALITWGYGAEAMRCNKAP